MLPCTRSGSQYRNTVTDWQQMFLFQDDKKRPVDALITLQSGMNISKADAIAHLAKWHSGGTTVRATYRTISGSSFLIGQITDLSPAAIKVTGSNAELLLYFRATSEYDYKDVRTPDTAANKERVNKYPTVIDIRFANGDRLDVMEYFSD